MNKLNVGDYVRSKRGTFYKITDLKPCYENGELIEEKQIVYVNGKNSGYNYEQFKTLIKLSSPNIMDLIEVGDYVNGERVIYKQYKEYPNPLLDHYVVDTIRCSYRENEIKSIVTKEQFENISYKVGE